MQMILVLMLAVLSTACAVAGANEAPPPHDEAHDHGGPPPGAPKGPPPHMEMPDHFKNLKVLPADTKKEQLSEIMRDMNRALGVRCNFCHVMEPQKDWAADTKHKEIARGMMRMTERISKEEFTWPKAPKATCFMCHRGNEKPVFKAPAGPEGGPHLGPPGAPPPLDHVPPPAP